MSSLTPEDFDEDETFAIETRLSHFDEDVASLQSYLDNQATKFDRAAAMDTANQKVQMDAIRTAATIFHAIVTQRDMDEPGEAPHTLKWSTPSAIPSSPVTMADITAATNLAAYLAAISEYSVPRSSASLVGGQGWLLYHDPGGGLVGDPNQPTPTELTPAFPVLLTEFDERNEERLDVDVGSYVLKNSVSTRVTRLGEISALLTQRKAFWEGLGFSG